MKKQCLLSSVMAFSLTLIGVRAFAAASVAVAQLKAQAVTLGAEEPNVAAAATPKAEDPRAQRNETSGGISSLFATPTTRKTSVSCEYRGREVTVPILRWETGVNITKDSKGQEVRQEYQYPIIELGDYQAEGDGGLCWNTCKNACDGYGVCWLSCTYHCTSQGGSGDPRKP